MAERLASYPNQQRVRCSGEEATTTSCVGSTPKTPTHQEGRRHSACGPRCEQNGRPARMRLF